MGSASIAFDRWWVIDSSFGIILVYFISLSHLQLPDKSIACLVRFYYSWKKLRSRANDRERQEKKRMEGGSEVGSENGTPEDSDVEEKVR